MFIALHDIVSKHRRRAVWILAILGVAAAVATAHSVNVGGHAHHGGTGGVDDVVLACLAVVETASLAIGALAVAKAPALRLRAPWGAPDLLRGAIEPDLGRPRPVARAGPPFVQVFRF
jgi:hypothetical protein